MITIPSAPVPYAFNEREAQTRDPRSRSWVDSAYGPRTPNCRLATVPTSSQDQAVGNG